MDQRARCRVRRFGRITGPSGDGLGGAAQRRPRPARARRCRARGEPTSRAVGDGDLGQRQGRRTGRRARSGRAGGGVGSGAGLPAGGVRPRRGAVGWRNRGRGSWRSEHCLDQGTRGCAAGAAQGRAGHRPGSGVPRGLRTGPSLSRCRVLFDRKSKPARTWGPRRAPRPVRRPRVLAPGLLARCGRLRASFPGWPRIPGRVARDVRKSLPRNDLGRC